jgi:hypothetical protein
MQNLWGTAERLREVQTAHRRFVTLWAIDQAHRMLETQFSTARSRDLGEADASIDLSSQDWSRLYRGSVLDD